MEIDENKAQNNKQTNQPANQCINSTGTRVPQDMLAHASTTLRIPKTMPQALQIQEQNKPKQYLTKLGCGKGHKSMMNRNRNEDNGRMKN